MTGLLIVTAMAVFAIYVDRRASGREADTALKYPPIGQMMEVDGVQLHVLIKGSGPDLVLIHGSNGNVRDFDMGLMDDLAQDYRVIAIDRPGHGWTDVVDPNGETLRDQVSLLQKTAASLGATSPIVLGQSFGGAVAMAWAVHEGENLAAVVTLGGVSHPWTTGLGSYYTTLSNPISGPIVRPLIAAFVSDKKIDTSLQEVFLPDAVPPNYADDFGVGLSVTRRTLRANALQRALLLDGITTIVDEYPQIDVPMEVLHGTADLLVSATIHAKALEQDNPQANVTLLEGGGHMPHHTHKGDVIAAVHRAAARAGLH